MRKDTFMIHFEPILNGDDAKKISNFAKELGYSSGYTDETSFLMDKAPDYILEKGVTDALTPKLLTEEVVPIETDNSDSVAVRTMRTMLHRIAPEDSFLIIDRFLYPKNPSDDYCNFFLSVFGDTLKRCNLLNIVVSPDHNRSIRDEIENEIKKINSSIIVNTKCTEDCHDRFWITDEKKGLFVGTSLNGIGKRFSLVDYLKSEDVSEIMKIFEEIN